MNTKSGKEKAQGRAKKSSLKRDQIEVSSGNVFADIGLPDAEELLIKSQLAIKIRRAIEQKGWTPTETARRIDIDQPEVSSLLRGKLPGFSVDRLFAILKQVEP